MIPIDGTIYKPQKIFLGVKKCERPPWFFTDFVKTTTKKSLKPILLWSFMQKNPRKSNGEPSWEVSQIFQHLPIARFQGVKWTWPRQWAGVVDQLTTKNGYSREAPPWSTMTPYNTRNFNMPRGSMYGIVTYIWVIFMVNVGRYTMHGSYWMEPENQPLEPWFSVSMSIFWGGGRPPPLHWLRMSPIIFPP